jgi:hypothetical protein
MTHRTTDQKLQEAVVAWTPQEARDFFAYLDRVAEQAETQEDENPDRASSPERVKVRLKPIYA